MKQYNGAHLGLKKRLIIIIGICVIILSNTPYVSSETNNSHGIDEYNVEDVSILIIFSIIGIIPEFYLAKKFSDFVNRQKLIKGVESQDD